MRYKYRGYWIVIEDDYVGGGWMATIWIVGHTEDKEIIGHNIFSLGMAQAKAENYIDKILSLGGILS